MKKSITIFIIAIMSIISVGCIWNKSNNSDSIAEPDDRKTYTMMISESPLWPFNPDWAIWQMIEEHTNAAFIGQVPAGAYNETLNIKITSGKMPDLMLMSSFTIANKYGQQGALTNILDYLDVMPHFHKWLAQYPEIKERYLSADGKMFMFPNQGFGETNRIIWMYREDIWRQNGLQIPATYDELYNVAKRLKQLYPNSYPLGAKSGGLSLISRMAANFETYNDVYYHYGKQEWLYGPIEENYKKLITYLHDFYQEGLIAPDWLTFTSKHADDLIAHNRMFILLDSILMDVYNDPLRKENPPFNMVFMPPPAGWEGGSRQNPYTHVVDSGMTLASTSTQIKDIMQTMDFFYSEQGREMSSWGKEGVTYSIVNGKKTYLEPFKNFATLRKDTGVATNGTYTWIDYDAIMTMAAPEKQDAFVQARKYDSKLQPKPAPNASELETQSSIGLAIVNHREENVAKFIIGERSLDDWDNYVSEVLKLGVDSLVNSYKTAYDRMKK